MTPVTSRLLVVDASVVQAAGQTSHPVSSSCRRSLDAILSICHRMAMTPALQDEWVRHAGSYARKWRVAMTAPRKVVEVVPRQLAWERARLPELSHIEKAALRKDRHLIEAACGADGVIVTLDTTVEQIWSVCGRRLSPPQAIRWVSPVRDGEAVLMSL